VISGPSRPLRVAVWSTGAVATIALRAIAKRPGLELVGVWVHSPEKVGRDVGELAGIDPIGLAATNDADSLIALKPDCVVYAASGPELDAAAVPDYIRFLRAGINVVTSTSFTLVFPPAFRQDWLAELNDAARDGGASLYASGIEPGFAADQFPLVLTTLSNRITSVRACEAFLYDHYGNDFLLKDVMGFALPLDATPLNTQPGALTSTWGPAVRMIASALDVELDEIREVYERRASDRPLQVAIGTLEAGTCGAVRMQVIGVVDGREAIIIEHVNRMAADIAPDWPNAGREDRYEVVINGEPNIHCELTMNDAGGAGSAAMVATAMRVLNAVPYVVEAAPGLVSSLDLPLTVPRNSLD
jgi:hypothetical protein